MAKVTSRDIQKARGELELMKEALDNLARFFRSVGGVTYERFRRYSGAHIAMNLGEDHEYLGKEMFTIEGLIDEVGEDDDEDGEDDDEDGE